MVFTFCGTTHVLWRWSAALALDTHYLVQHWAIREQSSITTLGIEVVRVGQLLSGRGYVGRRSQGMGIKTPISFICRCAYPFKTK